MKEGKGEGRVERGMAGVRRWHHRHVWDKENVRVCGLAKRRLGSGNEWLRAPPVDLPNPPSLIPPPPSLPPSLDAFNRAFYMRKVKFTQQNYSERLRQILADFPRVEVRWDGGLEGGFGRAGRACMGRRRYAHRKDYKRWLGLWAVSAIWQHGTF